MQTTNNREVNTKVKENQEKVQTYKSIFCLIGYCILNFSNNFAFTSYTPIWGYVAVFYNIRNIDVEWTNNMYYLTYMLLAIPFIKVIEVRLNFALQTSSVLTTLGNWIIWYSNTDYYFNLTGYLCLGVGQALFLATPVCIKKQQLDFGDIWFNVYLRSIVTCIGTQMVQFSMGCTYVFASVYFYGIETQEQMNEQIVAMNFLIAAGSTFCSIFIIIFVRQNQQFQYSFEVLLYFIQKVDLFNQLQEIYSNEEKFLSIMAFSMIIGMGWIYVTMLNAVLPLLNYTSIQINMIGVVYYFSGIIAGFFISLRIYKSTIKGTCPNMDTYIKVFIAIGLIAHIIESIWLTSLNYAGLIVLNILIGFGINSIYPLAILTTAETFFPIPSILPATLINLIAIIVGFGVSYLSFPVELQNYTLWISLYLLTPPILYLLLLNKTKYNKFTYSN